MDIYATFQYLFIVLQYRKRNMPWDEFDIKYNTHTKT